MITKTQLPGNFIAIGFVERRFVVTFEGDDIVATHAASGKENRFEKVPALVVKERLDKEIFDIMSYDVGLQGSPLFDDIIDIDAFMEAS